MIAPTERKSWREIRREKYRLPREGPPSNPSLETTMVVTFLPYPDIERSLRTLDKRRLGKQRLEAKQIIGALEGEGFREGIRGEFRGWVNHPATKMWEGCLPLLKKYYNASLVIWEERGGKNKILQPLEIDSETDLKTPWWWGWEPLHESHKAALVRKDSNYYSDLLPPDSIYLTLGYTWPHKHDLSTPFSKLFEPINPRQLLPKCEHGTCKNPVKRERWCGVHARKYLS